MGRKLGLTLEHVVAAAAEIADHEGLEALSLASVATKLGVRSPSLYNHVDGLAGLRRQLSIHASRLLADEVAVSAEGLEATVALRAIAEQLRSFARRHPGLYDAFLPAPTPQEDPELAAALARPTQVVRSVLDQMGVDPATVIPLIRALRASVHGFVHIELRGGFGLPDDIDESFTTTINLVIEAIAAHSTSPSVRRTAVMSVPRMLRGERVVLVPVAAAHVPELRRILATPEVRVRWPAEDASPRWPFDDPSATRFAVLREDAVVGLVQYDEEDEPDYRHASIDIFLDPAEHGRGVGRDAVATLARHLLHDRDHHRLVIDPAADNAPAVRCYAAVGFRPVGIMRQYEKDADGDGWHDALLMDLLAVELVPPR